MLTVKSIRNEIRKLSNSYEIPNKTPEHLFETIPLISIKKNTQNVKKSESQ